jgi:hypothetical protein
MDGVLEYLRVGMVCGWWRKLLLSDVIRYRG